MTNNPLRNEDEVDMLRMIKEEEDKYQLSGVCEDLRCGEEIHRLYDLIHELNDLIATERAQHHSVLCVECLSRGKTQ